jgi:hypothetical protein
MLGPQKNKEDKVIVLYDWDERDGPSAANMFLAKGYENVVLLSGGMKDFVPAHPFYIDGEPPEVALPSPPRGPASRLGGGASAAAAAGGGPVSSRASVVSRVASVDVPAASVSRGTPATARSGPRGK